MSDRRGFTLVELLVVAVLGSLVLLATYNVLITNQRTFTVNSEKIMGQQTVRAGMDLLFSELREISPPGGDILSMDEEEIEIRVMRSAGLVCDTAWVAADNAEIELVNLGDTIQADDSVWVYIEHDPGQTTDDEWLTAVADLRGATTCQSRDAQILRFTGAPTLWVSDTLTLGSLVRTWTTYTYSLDVIGSEYYLVRRAPGEAAVPLVGPLMPPSAGGTPGGVSFEYFDASDNVETVPADVAQIVVTLRTQSQARDAAGNLVTDSLKARIYTRN